MTYDATVKLKGCTRGVVTLLSMANAASTDGFYIDQYGQPVPPPGYDNRPRAATLPTPQGRAQVRDYQQEAEGALEFLPNRLYQYVAKWSPTETNEQHFFNVSHTAF